MDRGRAKKDKKEKKAKRKARGVIGSSRRGNVIHLLFSSWDGEPSPVPFALLNISPNNPTQNRIKKTIVGLSLITVEKGTIMDETSGIQSASHKKNISKEKTRRKTKK